MALELFISYSLLLIEFIVLVARCGQYMTCALVWLHAMQDASRISLLWKLVRENSRDEISQLCGNFDGCWTVRFCLRRKHGNEVVFH